MTEEEKEKELASIVLTFRDETFEKGVEWGKKIAIECINQFMMDPNDMLNEIEYSFKEGRIKNEGKE